MAIRDQKVTSHGPWLGSWFIGDRLPVLIVPRRTARDARVGAGQSRIKTKQSGILALALRDPCPFHAPAVFRQRWDFARSSAFFLCDARRILDDIGAGLIDMSLSQPARVIGCASAREDQG